MRTHHFLGLISIVVLIAAGCGKNGSVLAAEKAEPPSLNAQLRQLITARMQTARQTRDAVETGFQADTVLLGDLVTATNDLCNAELAAANTPEERIAAHKKRVAFFRQIEQRIEALSKVGVRGGEATKYATARYNRESAVIALMETCMATGQPYPRFDAVLELGAKNGALEP